MLVKQLTCSALVKNLMSELIKYPDFPCIKFKRRIVINKKKLQEWFDKNSGRFFCITLLSSIFCPIIENIKYCAFTFNVLYLEWRQSYGKNIAKPIRKEKKETPEEWALLDPKMVDMKEE